MTWFQDLSTVIMALILTTTGALVAIMLAHLLGWLP